MTIKWSISEKDIRIVSEFVANSGGPFVESRIKSNIERKNILVNEDSIIKSMLMCLLTTQQRYDPNHLISKFLMQKSFPVVYSSISRLVDVEDYMLDILHQNSFTKNITKIPDYFASNIRFLDKMGWDTFINSISILDGLVSKETEREVADAIDKSFKGFGSKQARNFLQSLGLTRFEIPLDAITINWFNDFGFPVTLSATALQEKRYYHFVSDGIQLLCEKAGIFPCVLDAAILYHYSRQNLSRNNILLY